MGRISAEAAIRRIAQIHSDDIDEDGRRYCMHCGGTWPCPTYAVCEAVGLWDAETPSHP